MSAATRATTASAPATIATRMLKTVKGSMSRDFDDCFEMFDGDEVLKILKEKAKTDPELVRGIIRHGCGNWLQEAV